MRGPRCPKPLLLRLSCLCMYGIRLGHFKAACGAYLMPCSDMVRHAPKTCFWAISTCFLPVALFQTSWFGGDMLVWWSYLSIRPFNPPPSFMLDPNASLCRSGSTHLSQFATPLLAQWFSVPPTSQDSSSLFKTSVLPQLVS